MSHTVRAALGAARFAPHDVEIQLGEWHPSAQGAMALTLAVEDGVITAADPHIGFMHRGAEKLFEVRDYRQIIMLANRHDWLAAFSSELGVVIAVERMLGINVPERAIWLRTLLAELTRIMAATYYCGGVIGHGSWMSTRDDIQTLVERASGGRVHTMLNRVGGLAHDLDSEWLSDVEQTLPDIEQCHKDIVAALHDSASQREGVAVLSKDDAIAYGTSGPVARASGLDLDLRRTEPYLAYGELQNLLALPQYSAGDAQSRMLAMCDTIPTSIELIAECIQRLATIDGPVNVLLPKVVRAPEGATYAWTEAPNGISGYYLVSSAERTPWRLKARTASFNNVQAMVAALPGTSLTRLSDAVGSFHFVAGDVDR